VALVGLALVLRGDPDGPSPDGTASPAGSSATSEPTSSTGNADRTPTIEVGAPPDVVDPMRPVALTGRVRGIVPGSSLVVQSSTGATSWTSFPLRPVVDDEGRFSTFVELGAAGIHRLRVLEPQSGAASRVVVVRVQ
jgi:hypothetical protein